MPFKLHACFTSTSRSILKFALNYWYLWYMCDNHIISLHMSLICGNQCGYPHWAAALTLALTFCSNAVKTHKKKHIFKIDLMPLYLMPILKFCELLPMVCVHSIIVLSIIVLMEPNWPGSTLIDLNGKSFARFLKDTSFVSSCPFRGSVWFLVWVTFPT